MKRRLFVLAQIGALLVSACGGAAVAPQASGSAASPTTAPTKVRAGYSNISASNLPAHIALEAGIFKANGLEVDLQLIEGGSKSMAALLASQIDVVGVGGTETMSAFAGGGSVVAVAVFVPVSTWQFFVPATYKGPADLKGKTMGIVTKGGSADIALTESLKRLGVDPKEVTIVEIGSTPGLAAAMIAGAVYAGPGHPPESTVLTKSGYRVVVDLAKERVPASDNALVTTKAFATANRSVVQRYLDSLIQGIARAKKDKPLALNVLKKMLSLTDDVSASETYDFYVQGIFPNYPHPDAAVFEASRKVLVGTNPKVADLDVTKVIDGSFTADAEKRGVATK